MTIRFTLIAVCLPVFLLLGCKEKESPHCQPAPGPPMVGRWQAHLKADGRQVDFEFSITGKASDRRAFLHNGSEKIEIPLIKETRTEIRLEFPHYDSRIEALFGSGPHCTFLLGTWTKSRGNGHSQQMEFVANLIEEPQQLSVLPSNAPKLSGRWRVRFSSSEEDAVAILETKPGRGIEGTFLTTTGDYRYLSGSRDATGSAFTLSCFDGAHAFVFRARLTERGIIEGDFWSGATWHETFRAERDDKAKLNDGFQRTRWNDQVPLASLSFPDLKGKIRSLNDKAFQGRARIIQIFGTWCPNCHDAAQFLAELQRDYGEKGLSILGLAFEHDMVFERSVRQVEHYQKRNGCSYPVLIAGTSNKKAATAAFRGLDFIRSFPTTIFLHADGRIRAIYSGFDGPATGQAHQTLKQSYRTIIEDLLAN
ncbi:MAG: TlpA disulfide reductase family protein [Planctomycetota bacterium]